MRRKPFIPRIAMTLLLGWYLGGERAEAEVRLSGTPDRVVLTTNDATIAEILYALRSAFHVEVKLQGATARKFTGVYSGPVRQVLSRLLTGDNYIFHFASDGMSILLLGRSAADNTAVLSSLVAGSQVSRLVALRQEQTKKKSD
jgi:hypothetical protein